MFSTNTLSRNCRVYSNNSHSGTPYTPFVNQTSNLRGLTSAFSYPCGLFCTRQKLNSLVFKRFRTLCAKHPGVGGGGTLSTSRFSSRISRCRRRDPSSVSVNSAHSAASALIPVPVFAGHCPLPATRSFPCYPDSCEPSSFATQFTTTIPRSPMQSLRLNPILNTDSYKLTHWWQYPPGTRHIYS